MPHQPPRGGDQPGRRLLRFVLALPVFAWVYAEQAAAWLGSRRPAALTAAFVVAVVAADAVLGGAPAGAARHGGQPTAAGVPPVLVIVPSASPGASALPPAGSSDAGVLVLPLAAAGPDPTASAPGPTAAPAPAAVVRFRPLAGKSSVPPPAQVSVRFVAAMDRSATQAAFSVTVNGSPRSGRVRWAEGDTVLVFTPSAPIPYGATVRLAVGGTAQSAGGTALGATRVATFTVMPRPTPSPASVPAVAKPTPGPTARPAPASTTASSAWRWPLIGPITQYFGQSLTIYGYHYGIDISGQTGDPVVAARAGTVIAAGHVASDPCGGIQVRIDHGGGFVSWYHHFSAVLVQVGQQVAAGTVIGRVGATGCAFGSHLHFAILRNGTFVNPLDYLPRR